MLTKIREKLKGWVIGVLLLLVAIPLVFMGLGNYQTTSNSYPLVIDEQSISAAKIEQEVFQYRQALEKNFQGNIPPFYTNSFIKNLTINYMTRAILLDNNSRNIGLVFHNESIVDEIMNTSAFKDETGFNNNLYRRQLLAIGMDQKTYERYIYQKGITEQLQNSITKTSFLTREEKTNLIQFRYHKRIGSYLILPYLEVKKTIKINEDELKEYYSNNKDSFNSEAEAIFNYIDVDKNSIISNVEINDQIISDIYQTNKNNGDYYQPAKYEIHHLLITNANKEASNLINKAKNELQDGKSFAGVTEQYSDDDETISNKGYLGNFYASDLPDYLSNELKNLKIGEISRVIVSDKGFHLISIKDMTKESNLDFSSAKKQIIKDYKKETGSRRFFDLTEKISEANFQKNSSLADLVNEFELKNFESRLVTKSDGFGIFNFGYVRESLFNDEVVIDNKTSDLVYINDDRYIIAQIKNYNKPSQLSFNDSKSSIYALLLTQKTDSLINSDAKELRDSLNAGLNKNNNYELIRFNESYDTTKLSDELKNVIFSAIPKTGYSLHQFDNKDYIIFVVDDITYPKDAVENDKLDDFSNFLSNTRSEAEFSTFYDKLKSSAKITIDEEYIERD